MDQDVNAANEGFFELPPHTKQATKAIMLLLFFSFLMFTMPFATFYGTKYVLNEYFSITGYASTVWSVVASVLTVNLIILVYAYIAYHEQEYDMEGNPIGEGAADSDLKED